MTDQRFESYAASHFDGSPFVPSGLLTGLMCGLVSQVALANPGGMTVANGVVSATQNGAQLNIQASHNAVINWQNFNINPGETTTFTQPSAVSVVWNRIFDANPSQIWGSLNANGYVVLMNQNGFYFGPNSVVNVGGFAVTTATPPPGPAGAGGMWQFNGAPPLASIINYGEIKATTGGSVFLLAERVENHGTISAPAGEIRLGAGKEVLLCERPDGRGLSASVKLPEGTVDNSGKVIADAGTVALYAQVVNQNGLIQANSVAEKNGVIELVASESVNLGSESLLQAKGDGSEASPGGSISIQSEGSFVDAKESRIDVGGSASKISVQATRDISLNGVWDLNNSPELNDAGSLLALEAGRHIGFGENARITSSAGWSVRLAAGVDFSDAQHPVRTGVGGIYLGGYDFSSGTPLTTGGGSIETADGSVDLEAGHEIRLGAGFVRTSAGGSISVKTGDGDLDPGKNANGYDFLRSGYFVSVGGLGGIGTANGGDVNIDSGHDILANGGMIGAFGSDPGNVTVHAAHQALGTYMLRNGNGLITAGVVLQNGDNLLDAAEIISAQGDIGSPDSLVSLGLISGSWRIFAGGDIWLNEVFNPNGSMNANRFVGSIDPEARVKFHFDYSVYKEDPLTHEVLARDASAAFAAGDGVHLLGTSTAHAANNENLNRIPVYPPQLEIHAGKGGVELGNDLILYPSPTGRLNIETTDGGSMRSSLSDVDDVTGSKFIVPTFHTLTMSDSPREGQSILDNNGNPKVITYQDFAGEHAATPIHLSDPDPVSIKVSGNIENFSLTVPKRAVIEVAGDVLNFSFLGQNLHSSDLTQFTIGGDYIVHSDRAFVTLAEDPNLAVLDPLLTENTDILKFLSYDPATRTVGFVRQMDKEVERYLLNPRVHDFDLDGRPLKDEFGNFVYVGTAPFASEAAIKELFSKSLETPNANAFNGLQLGGPGSFKLSARNMDLGSSQGIRTVGLFQNPALIKADRAEGAALGASISVDLQQNLKMDSSQIATFNGGEFETPEGIKLGIQVTAGGNIDVGSQERFTSDDTPKGIYTVRGGAISVKAHGNVEVNGSRIATYDGGDVTVSSETGFVDAGGGAKGFFYLSRIEVDPATGEILTDTAPDKLFGSGILALTSPTTPDSTVKVGNIKVDAAQDISANAGGILQIAFNRADQSHAHVDLTAGRDIIANQSGVLGGSVNLKAGGNIEGLVVARQNIGIEGRNVSVTALASGGVSVKGSESVSGTIVGAGNVSVSGAEVSASVISTGGNASTSGDSAGAKVGAFAQVSAPAAQQTTQEADKTVASKKPANEDEEEKKKRAAAAPVLSKTTGRVTVILPNK